MCWKQKNEICVIYNYLVFTVATSTKLQIPCSLTIMLNIFIDFQPEDLGRTTTGNGYTRGSGRVVKTVYPQTPSWDGNKTGAGMGWDGSKCLRKRVAMDSNCAGMGGDGTEILSPCRPQRQSKQHQSTEGLSREHSKSLCYSFI